MYINVNGQCVALAGKNGGPANRHFLQLEDWYIVQLNSQCSRAATAAIRMVAGLGPYNTRKMIMYRAQNTPTTICVCLGIGGSLFGWRDPR